MLDEQNAIQKYIDEKKELQKLILQIIGQSDVDEKKIYKSHISI